jgi:hypothetical protein
MHTEHHLDKGKQANFIIWLAVLVLITLGFSVFESRSSSGVEAGKTAPAGSPERARSAFDFVNSIGANTHLNYFDRTYGNFALVEKELCSIGIRHLRDGVHLQNADYNETLYSRWSRLGKCGIRFDAVLDPRNNLGPITTELLKHVDDLSGRTIESFEGPNEMDISGASDWATTVYNFQKTLHNAASSLEKSEHISTLAPSLAFASHGNEFAGTVIDADSGNLHPYPAGKMPSVIFPEQTDLGREIFGSKKIVFTESGYHNALSDHHDQPPISEAAAAKYIPRLFLEDFARGVPRTYLYEFLDEAADPRLSDNQLHWGLVRANGTEKPAFASIKRLIAEVGDTAEPAHLSQFRWSLDTMAETTHHLLLQKSGGEFDLILWREVSSFDISRQSDIDNPPAATVLTLGRVAKQIRLYEPVVQSEPIKTYTNTASVPILIPDHPLVIAITLD